MGLTVGNNQDTFNYKVVSQFALPISLSVANKGARERAKGQRFQLATQRRSKGGDNGETRTAN